MRANIDRALKDLADYSRTILGHEEIELFGHATPSDK
jgi:hypothetical protein